jgi:hypothetical protein
MIPGDMFRTCGRTRRSYIVLERSSDGSLTVRRDDGRVRNVARPNTAGYTKLQTFTPQEFLALDESKIDAAIPYVVIKEIKDVQKDKSTS